MVSVRGCRIYIMIIKLRILSISFFLLSFVNSFSQTWEINWDSNAIKQKKEYLASIQPSGKNKPNIILIVADDLGKHDLSVYGNLIIKTPHLDALAKGGAIFSDAYASAPICSPSRAAMLTGRYQQRFGYQLQPLQRYPRSKFEWWAFKNIINTSDLEPAPYQKYPSKNDIKKQGLPPSEITISEMLKQSGYATAWIGKWHLGYHEPLLPGNFGFDYQYGCYEAYTLYDDPKDKSTVNARINEFTDKHIWKGGRKGACAIRKNGTLVNETEYITYAFGREAKEFISKNKNNPFFLYLPVTAPHTPYQAPKEIYDSLSFITEHNKRVYYSMIIALDNMVGDLISFIKNENLLENTVIIFTSDNGAPLYSKTITNSPHSGGKFTFYEGGINVPMIVHHEGKIKPLTTINQPVMLFDLFTTIAALAGIKLSDQVPIDGASLVPALYMEDTKILHPKLFWYSDYNMAMRKGDWKIILNTADNTLELYHIINDRSELYDLSKVNEYHANTLSKELLNIIPKLPPKLWPRLVDYNIIINGKKTRWAI